ncbi:hypothetical protein D0Y65_030204 [Glycine soja]|uniref:Cyclin-dependent protein kinase inhibitor SMR2 n=1 Tax=Glycine soja TaxID=3848 RepID=A0A445I2L3_GLYSO|nr:hypothetical protein glysoja_008242 [Glycine soja]RZB80381.1 hypothetical protein D0Y65_030204 [Glycine soja]
MSTTTKGSTTEQPIPPQVEEESSVCKQEEEGEDAKIRVVIAQEGIEEFEECKTPTGSGYKIPIVKKCPLAPRKKRIKRAMPPFSSRVKRSSSSGLSYLLRHEEVESFFQSMFELTRVNKRCRSV